MKVLVLGAKSQIARSLKKMKSSVKYLFCGKKEININNFRLLKKKIYKIRPKIIINCAAFTNVEEAEKKKIKANKTNNLSVKNLSNICNEIKSLLIHISTDYVFDGKSKRPYLETSATSPINYYGKTKLKGENSIINSKCNYIIIRISWLFSKYGNNFAQKIIKNKKKILYVVNDQFGCPTDANDLARAINYIISKKNILNLKEIFHFTGPKVCSWYEFAKLILTIKKNKKKTKIITRVKPIDSKKFKTNVKRPRYSVLNNQKFLKFYNFKRLSLKKSISNLI